VLGAGLIAFGLHVLRPAFEPFVGDSTLIPFFEHLRSDSVRGLITCALLGAAIGFMISMPGPDDNGISESESTIVATVISLGRRRMVEPSITAST